MDAPGCHIRNIPATLSISSAFFVFALAVAVFQHLRAVAGGAGVWVDLLTPFVVIGTAALVLIVSEARWWPTLLALAAAIAYVDGHGIHLAADSIAAERLFGDAEDRAYFWDERFGHIEWHIGWIGLLVAFAVAETQGSTRAELNVPLALVSAALLGVTFFTNTVEGGTWWLTLAGAAGFSLWASIRPGPLLSTCAAALVVGAILIGVWAIWQGGLPQFSEVEFLP